MPGLRGFLCFFLFLVASTANAALEHRWSDASKQAVGTAYGEQSSRVWFTVSHGILNEVYYPYADTAQVGDSQLLFTNVGSEHLFLEEKRDFNHKITHPRGVPRPIIEANFKHGDSIIRF